MFSGSGFLGFMQLSSHLRRCVHFSLHIHGSYSSSKHEYNMCGRAEQVWGNFSERYQDKDIQTFLHDATAVYLASDATGDRLRNNTRTVGGGGAATGGDRTSGLEMWDLGAEKKKLQQSKPL